MIDDIDENTNFSTIKDSIGARGSGDQDITNRINQIHSYLTDKTANTTWTGPNVKVEVDAPTALNTEQLNLSNSTSGGSFTNTASLKSGVKIKLHPQSTANVFIGGSSVSTANGYILLPGDDVFIEISQLNRVTAVPSQSGTNVVLFAIGY